MPSSPFWKLRRLAGRGPRVLARRKQAAPALAAYDPRLPEAAGAYAAAYDQATGYESTWRRELEEGRGAAAALLKLIQAWVPHAARDIPGFNAADFGDRPSVPDHVIGDAERLADAVDDHRNAAGEPLAYREAALGDLGPATAAAHKEWNEAEAADQTYQALLATVRATGARFDEELIAFRRSLLAVVGRHDKDFQKLRSEHVGERDEEDDEPPVPPPPGAAPA